MWMGVQHHTQPALPLGRDSVPIVQEAVWAPGSGQMVWKILLKLGLNCLHIQNGKGT